MVNDPVAFPNLTADNHQEVGNSPFDDSYNCIAWAAGIDDEWWEGFGKYPWPGNAPRDSRCTSLLIVYESQGFMECLDGSLETDVDKLVIYSRCDRAEYTHAARQLPNGRWTSKLGEWELIEHDSPENLTGGLYGRLWKFLKRKRGSTEDLRFAYLFPLNRRAYEIG